jgi:hypothetical protein
MSHTAQVRKHSLFGKWSIVADVPPGDSDSPENRSKRANVAAFVTAVELIELMWTAKKI